ncbi:MAG: hypothetical protein ABTQ73_04960 [Caldilineales bacterium]
MSQTANTVKRVLLWMSGAPAEADAASQPSAEPAGLPLNVETAVQADADAFWQAELIEPGEPVAVEPDDPELTAAEALAATPKEPQPIAPIPLTAFSHAGEPVNDAAAYGVVVQPVTVAPGTTCWRAVRVHHLTPEENHGNHHIFLDALNEAGERVFDAAVRVTWPGGQQTVTITKPLGEPGADFALWKWQMAAVEMNDLPSDRVEGLHTDHPDEASNGNTRFHHSFSVVFQRTTAAQPAPADDGKLINRLMLLGSPTAPRTTVHLELARSFLLTRRPTISFSVEEALHAREVILLGATVDISAADEARLSAAGCQVQRITGTPTQISAALAALP